MQTKDQILTNWKVMATASTVVALGIAGVAIASPGNAEPSTPPAIEIADQRGVDISLITSTNQPTFEIVPGPTYGPFGDDSIESMASIDVKDPMESMDDMDSIDSVDSPDTMDDMDSIDSVDSPDTMDDMDSIDSVDSPDSDDSLDSD